MPVPDRKELKNVFWICRSGEISISSLISPDRHAADSVLHVMLESIIVKPSFPDLACDKQIHLLAPSAPKVTPPGTGCL